MRTLITTIKNKIAFRSSTIVTAATIAVVAPAVALAWGPDRATFTEASPADYVTFNSITDNRKWGDERNFMRIRDIESGETFKDSASLQPGKEYEVLVLYHNNARESLNASGVGVAEGAYARTEIPAIVDSGASNVKAMAYVGAANANPAAVYDHIDLTNTTNADIALRYVKNSAKIASNGSVNGTALTEDLFANGVPLGYNSLDGILPGCDEYSGYITFKLVADAPEFTFTKDVRLAGTKEWKDDITVNQGDKVEYRLFYKNIGTIEQKNVVVKDELPQGLTYTAGETDLVNSNNPNGKRLDDSINAGGVDIGHYLPGGGGYVYLFAKADGNPCSVLTNTAAAETRNGYLKDTATVRIDGDCEVPVEALPTTGPAEVIIGLIGVGAMTFGIVYYIKSRRDLDSALLHKLSTPTFSKTPPVSDPETTKVDDVDADKKQKTVSGHKK